MRRCPPHSSSCEQGSAVRRTREIAPGTCGRCDGSRMGQVERVRSHEVLVQKASERHHEAKPRPENRGNQMGLFTEKTIQGKPDYKARLVVQGCQEDKGYIRTDAPTGSRDAFFMTLSAASQSGWDYSVFDAQSAYLQSDGIKRLAVADASQKSASWDEARASVCCFWFDLRDERCWTCVVRKCLRQLVLWSQSWNKVSTTCMDHLDLRLSCTHMSTTFLSAFKKASKKYKDALQHLVHELYLKQQSGLVVYC